MTHIQIEIDDNLDRLLDIYRAENRLDGKNYAVIEILKKFLIKKK